MRDLPAPVARAIDAVNAEDTGAFLSTFTADHRSRAHRRRRGGRQLDQAETGSPPRAEEGGHRI
jgi:hypothetical protein